MIGADFAVKLFDAFLLIRYGFHFDVSEESQKLYHDLGTILV